jgi:16S rRNA (guanine(966)-N(2))-methyltransferase RsmD
VSKLVLRKAKFECLFQAQNVMRVIAGEFRSRRLKSVDGNDVRPTPDRLRETLFNVIANQIAGKTFLDAYAGTGAVGIEALSRGAARVIFIEKNRLAVEVIEENVKSLGARSRAQIIRGAVKIYLAAQKADIIFIDPPYDATEEYASSMKAAANAEPELLIAQHDRRTLLEPSYEPLHRFREIRQGDNVLSFYRGVE